MGRVAEIIVASNALLGIAVLLGVKHYARKIKKTMFGDETQEKETKDE